MSMRALGTRLHSEAIVLPSCLAAAAALAGCGGSSARSTSSRVGATTCGVPYTFTVDGHEVPSGSCAGQMPGHHPPHVEVHPGEQFSLLVTGNRNGARVTRAFPVPKPTSSVVVITDVHGQTVHYEARTTGTTRLQVRSRFCPSNPRVSTCTVLAVSVAGESSATTNANASRPDRPIWCPAVFHAQTAGMSKPNRHVSGSFDTRTLLGRSASNAEAIARQHGCSWRVVNQGGALTADGRANRVDADIINGKVTAVGVY